MNIQEYVVPMIAVGVYLIMAMFKPLMHEEHKKFIPLMCGLFGILFNTWANGWNFSFAIFLEGLASGLSATGIDQLIKQSTGHYEKEGE